LTLFNNRSRRDVRRASLPRSTCSSWPGRHRCCLPDLPRRCRYLRRRRRRPSWRRSRRRLPRSTRPACSSTGTRRRRRRSRPRPAHLLQAPARCSRHPGHRRRRPQSTPTAPILLLSAQVLGYDSVPKIIINDTIFFS